VITGTTGAIQQHPVSSQFLIGDYVTPGNLVPLSSYQEKSWNLAHKRSKTVLF